jgi:hypothetical protein
MSTRTKPILGAALLSALFLIGSASGEEYAPAEASAGPMASQGTAGHAPVFTPEIAYQGESPPAFGECGELRPAEDSAELVDESDLLGGDGYGYQLEFPDVRR